MSIFTLLTFLYFPWRDAVKWSTGRFFFFLVSVFSIWCSCFSLGWTISSFIFHLNQFIFFNFFIFYIFFSLKLKPEDRNYFFLFLSKIWFLLFHKTNALFLFPDVFDLSLHTQFQNILWSISTFFFCFFCFWLEYFMIFKTSFNSSNDSFHKVKSWM